MNLRLLSLAAILGSLGFVLPLHADDKPAEKPKTEETSKEHKKDKKDLPDYIRFVDDAKSARLEIAIKSFKLPSGAVVDLVGAVHIADASFYADLNKRFDSYDAVLFELVGDPRAVTDKEEVAAEKEAEKKGETGGGAIRFIQMTAGRLLKLTFQLGQIDYTKPNMVHADASAEEFEAMQKERGESMLKLFLRAMKAQMSGELDDLPLQDLDTFGLLRILMSKDSAAEFKIVLAKMFDQAESMTKIMDGDNGSAILTGRNEVVLKKIKQVLRDKTKQHIAVFYGAAHMPGIQGMLTKDLKAEAAGEQWLAGWTMPHDPPAEKKASAPEKKEP